MINLNVKISTHTQTQTQREKGGEKAWKNKRHPNANKAPTYAEEQRWGTFEFHVKAFLIKILNRLKQREIKNTCHSDPCVGVFVLVHLCVQLLLQLLATKADEPPHPRGSGFFFG